MRNHFSNPQLTEPKFVRGGQEHVESDDFREWAELYNLVRSGSYPGVKTLLEESRTHCGDFHKVATFYITLGTEPESVKLSPKPENVSQWVSWHRNILMSTMYGSLDSRMFRDSLDDFMYFAILEEIIGRCYGEKPYTDATAAGHIIKAGEHFIQARTVLQNPDYTDDGYDGLDPFQVQLNDVIAKQLSGDFPKVLDFFRLKRQDNAWLFIGLICYCNGLLRDHPQMETDIMLAFLKHIRVRIPKLNRYAHIKILPESWQKFAVCSMMWSCLMEDDVHLFQRMFGNILEDKPGEIFCTLQNEKVYRDACHLVALRYLQEFNIADALYFLYMAGDYETLIKYLTMAVLHEGDRTSAMVACISSKPNGELKLIHEYYKFNPYQEDILVREPQPVAVVHPALEPAPRMSDMDAFELLKECTVFFKLFEKTGLRGEFSFEEYRLQRDFMSMYKAKQIEEEIKLDHDRGIQLFNLYYPHDHGILEYSNLLTKYK
jgi:hypothetical protein